MKAKLIKNHFGFEYFLADENGSAIAISDNGKLSKQNCDEIFGIYSPSELSKVLTEGERGAFEFGYCLAREHNSHKVFTLEDVKKAYMDGVSNGHNFGYPAIDHTDKYIQSLQQSTEIEVEIEMECLDPNCDGVDKKGVCIPGDKPKLDSEGCLILKHVV
jgi:hypothetical protein